MEITVMSLQEAKWGSEMMLPYAGKVKISNKGKLKLDKSIADQIITAMPDRFCHEQDYSKLSKEIRERKIHETPVASETQSPPLAGAVDFIISLREGIKQSIEKLQEADKFLEAQQKLGEELRDKDRPNEATKEDKPKAEPKATNVKETPEQPSKESTTVEDKASEEEAASKKEATVSKLKKMNKSDLQDVIKRANEAAEGEPYPEEDWAELTNAKLVEYITENIL